MIFTHEDRVMFPEAKLTKGDLIAYYDAVADLVLPHLRDRPMTRERLLGLDPKKFTIRPR